MIKIRFWGVWQTRTHCRCRAFKKKTKGWILRVQLDRRWSPRVVLKRSISERFILLGSIREQLTATIDQFENTVQNTSWIRVGSAVPSGVPDSPTDETGVFPRFPAVPPPCLLLVPWRPEAASASGRTLEVPFVELPPQRGTTNTVVDK